jgi:hypothetical protein
LRDSRAREGARERSADDHALRACDQLALESAEADGEVDADVAIAVPQRQDERLRHDLMGVAKEWVEGRTRNEAQDLKRPIDSDRDHGVDVRGEPWLAASAGGKPGARIRSRVAPIPVIDGQPSDVSVARGVRRLIRTIGSREEPARRWMFLR